MAEWQPDQEKLSQVGMLLGGCADPSNHGFHVAALQMLDNAKREVPDFGCYLMLVRTEEFTTDLILNNFNLPLVATSVQVRYFSLDY